MTAWHSCHVNKSLGIGIADDKCFHFSYEEAFFASFCCQRFLLIDFPYSSDNIPRGLLTEAQYHFVIACVASVLSYRFIVALGWLYHCLLLFIAASDFRGVHLALWTLNIFFSPRHFFFNDKILI